MEESVNIPITYTHVEQIFGIPPSGRKLVLDTHRHHDGRVPSIIEIKGLMVETKNVEEFRRLFIIFVCVVILAPTTCLEGHHALWHAPPKVVTEDVNWRQFLLDELMHEVNDYRQSRNTYIKGCLLFLQVRPSQKNHILYQLYLSFSCDHTIH